MTPMKQGEGVWEPQAGRAPISCRPMCRRRPPLAYAANTGRRISAPSSIRGSILPRPAHRLTAVQQAISRKGVQSARSMLNQLAVRVASPVRRGVHHGMHADRSSAGAARSCSAVGITPMSPAKQHASSTDDRFLWYLMMWSHL